MKRLNKEIKERVMEHVNKANSGEYEASVDIEGKPMYKKASNIKKGRTSRAAGSRFELKVRKDLEDKGWVIDKWSNNVDLDERKIAPAKRKYNPFKKVMVIGTGFPDFIAIKHIHEETYSVIGIEVKMNGILSKIEKEKCIWYLQNNTFSQIWIARAVKEGRKIIVKYDDFLEKYGKKFGLLSE